jgi:ubiquinone/menaquinone biosynthesis C-methylase UbiE
MSSYGKFASAFDFISSPETPLVRDLIALHGPFHGSILDIGCGTGRGVFEILHAHPDVHATGLDLSDGMLLKARSKTVKLELTQRVRFIHGSALSIPETAECFDHVISVFFLEILSEDDILVALREALRVLRAGGTIAVASMLKEDGGSPSVTSRLYHFLHKVAPSVVDCRPISIFESLSEAGFIVKNKKTVRLYGIPVGLAIGQRPPFPPTPP